MSSPAYPTHIAAQLRCAGRVVEFDADVGLGTVSASGPTPPEGSRYLFHCTQISDGSRRIDVGTEVLFSVVPGRLGTWEAASVDAHRVGRPQAG